MCIQPSYRYFPVCDPWCALFRKLEDSHILLLSKNEGVTSRWALIWASGTQSCDPSQAGLDQLQILISRVDPSAQNQSKMSKSNVLSKSVEYIQRMNSRRESVDAEIASLQAQVQQLNDSIKWVYLWSCDADHVIPIQSATRAATSQWCR